MGSLGPKAKVNILDMRQVRFGLRYKILALLTIIPVFTLAVYLALALQIFRSDKLAYVFDSNSNVAESIAAQTRAQFNTVLISSRPLFQSYLKNRSTQLSQNYPSDAVESFQNLPLISTAAIYKSAAPGQPAQLLTVLEKTPGEWAQAVANIGPELAEALQKASTQKIALAAPFGSAQILGVEHWQSDTEAFDFVVMSNIPDLVKTFVTPISQTLYLIDYKGTILFGPREDMKSNISSHYALHFLSQDQRLVSQGTEVVKDEATGEEMLISYSRTGVGDLMVISAVSKAKALSAVQLLIRKSLLFFCLLISITIFIGLFASRSVTSAISSLLSATRKVAEGKFDIRVKVAAKDEVGVLADNFNIMAAEVSRLVSQTAEKARMEGELQTAKTVQETLFPPAKNRIANVDIVGYYEPASECGGDWWNCSSINGKVFLWIGDATGHGAPAALITSAAKSAATIIESLNVGPAEAMKLLNQAICQVARGRIMMTFFIASYDPDTRKLVYANASHDPPFLIKKTALPPKKKDLITLNEVTNPRLGQSMDSIYEEAELILDPEDSIIFYTDGVPDIRNGKDEAWGERDFLKAILSAQKDFPPAEKVAARIVATFQDFRKDGSLVDDVTFFVTKCT